MLTSFAIAAQAVRLGVDGHGAADFGKVTRFAGSRVDISFENVSIGFVILRWRICHIRRLLLAQRRRYGVPAWHGGQFVQT
jgi:hypothetical protein